MGVFQATFSLSDQKIGKLEASEASPCWVGPRHSGHSAAWEMESERNPKETTVAIFMVSWSMSDPETLKKAEARLHFEQFLGEVGPEDRFRRG